MQPWEMAQVVRRVHFCSSSSVIGVEGLCPSMVSYVKVPGGAPKFQKDRQKVADGFAIQVHWLCCLSVAIEISKQIQPGTSKH